MKILFVIMMLLSSTAVADWLPDPAITPGAVRVVTVKELCTTSTKAVRHTTSATKAAVYRKYGEVPRRAPECTGPSNSCFEVDHLVPLEVGGADVIENLWPQKYDGEWGAHRKDLLENLMHRKVCKGELSIQDAQKALMENWIDGYKKYLP
jgi:hypothetical protein